MYRLNTLDLKTIVLNSHGLSMTFTTCRFIAGCEYHATTLHKKTVDRIMEITHIPFMKKVIVKIDRRDISFRVTIPRRVIKYKGWHDVEYVLLEESGPDRIIIRRFIDGSALETDDQKRFPGFN